MFGGILPRSFAALMPAAIAAMLNGAFAAGQLATGRHVKDHFTQRATRLAFVGLQLVEAVQRLFGGFNRPRTFQ